jgi:hypothetical protein
MIPKSYIDNRMLKRSQMSPFIAATFLSLPRSFQEYFQHGVSARRKRAEEQMHQEVDSLQDRNAIHTS